MGLVKTRFSHARWVVSGWDRVADEEYPEPVVGAVAEPAGDAAAQIDEAVDGFVAAVAGAAGGKVGQQLGAPLAEGPAQSSDR